MRGEIPSLGREESVGGSDLSDLACTLSNIQ